MKKQLHRFITLFLILSFAISALMYLFFDVAQFRLKIKAQQNISANRRLQIVKTSLTEFNKSNEHDELWINGKLYDVSSYVIINDSVSVTVFHDEQEETLVSVIADSFEPNDKYSSDNIVHVCKHRIHARGDGKVLVSRYRVEVVKHLDIKPPISNFTEYSPRLSFAVIKPPPRVS